MDDKYISMPELCKAFKFDGRLTPDEWPVWLSKRYEEKRFLARPVRGELVYLEISNGHRPLNLRKGQWIVWKTDGFHIFGEKGFLNHFRKKIEEECEHIDREILGKFYEAMECFLVNIEAEMTPTKAFAGLMSKFKALGEELGLDVDDILGGLEDDSE